MVNIKEELQEDGSSKNSAMEWSSAIKLPKRPLRRSNHDIKLPWTRAMYSVKSEHVTDANPGPVICKAAPINRTNSQTALVKTEVCEQQKKNKLSGHTNLRVKAEEKASPLGRLQPPPACVPLASVKKEIIPAKASPLAGQGSTVKKEIVPAKAAPRGRLIQKSLSCDAVPAKAMPTFRILSVHHADASASSELPKASTRTPPPARARDIVQSQKKKPPWQAAGEKAWHQWRHTTPTKKRRGSETWNAWHQWGHMPPTKKRRVSETRSVATRAAPTAAPWEKRKKTGLGIAAKSNAKPKSGRHTSVPATSSACSGLGQRTSSEIKAKSRPCVMAKPVTPEGLAVKREERVEADWRRFVDPRMRPAPRKRGPHRWIVKRESAASA